MVDTGRALALAATAFVIIVIPGPSVLFVISRGVTLGRRAGLATVLGNTAGLAVQLVAVTAGLGAVVARSVALFTFLKLLGAPTSSSSVPRLSGTGAPSSTPSVAPRRRHPRVASCGRASSSASPTPSP